MLYNFFLILFLIYIISRLFIRYILPYLIRYFLKHHNQNINQPQNKKHYKKKGEINIDFIPEKDKKNTDNKNFGEYVNYEEIDDNETDNN